MKHLGFMCTMVMLALTLLLWDGAARAEGYGDVFRFNDGSVTLSPESCFKFHEGQIVGVVAEPDGYGPYIYATYPATADRLWKYSFVEFKNIDIARTSNDNIVALFRIGKTWDLEPINEEEHTDKVTIHRKGWKIK